jgi:hypothetical protein
MQATAEHAASARASWPAVTAPLAKAAGSLGRGGLDACVLSGGLT